MNAAREPRLDLTPFAPTDARAMCEIDGDPEHQRRFDFPGGFVPPLGHSAATIARWDAERAAGSRFVFAVRDHATGELVGGCELEPDGEGTANLSFWTHPRHRQRGVASEAVRQLRARAFAEFGFRRVELVADPDNVASRRIAIRNGFVEAGVQDGRVLHVLSAGE
ncbi:MAG TPA: GNAT family N-acetyltransferase [Longimicrobium sp.]|jgi:RimJ/RimL family protein N-acetyltransferase